MKFKSIELELPPLGEYVCIREKNNENEDDLGVDYGFFYLRYGERSFQSTSLVSLFSLDWSSEADWALMPEFKSIQEELPEVGTSVLGMCIDEETGFQEYCYVVLLKDEATIFVKGKEIDGWLEIEAFDRD